MIFPNHWLMVRLNLTQENVKKQLRLLKNAKTLLNVWRKESSIRQINRDFYLKSPKSQTSLKKYVKNGASKNCRSVRKVSKTQNGNKS